MKAKELREKSVGDLKKELLAILKEQFNLRMQKGTGEGQKPHHHKRTRRIVARIHTVLQEKESKV